jgi:hypothetical protein
MTTRPLRKTPFYVSGPTVLTWKKSDPSGHNYHFLATGSHMHSTDPRIRLGDVNEQGSTLTIEVTVGDRVARFSFVQYFFLFIRLPLGTGIRFSCTSLVSGGCFFVFSVFLTSNILLAY